MENAAFCPGNCLQKRLVFNIFRENDGDTMALDSLFRKISGIIGNGKKKVGFLMPQSEMETFIQLQKEIIEKNIRSFEDTK